MCIALHPFLIGQPHRVRYLDLKIDVAPNAIETLTDERVANIRRICDENVK